MEVTEQLVEHQRDLETEMAGLGLARYRKLLAETQKDGREAATDYGQLIITRAIEPLAEAVVEFIAEAKTGKAGRRHTALPYLEQVDPDVLALITLNTVINGLTQVNTIQNTAISLGTAIQDEIRFREFANQNPGLFKAVMRGLKKRSASNDWKKTVLVHTMNNKTDLEVESWPDRTLFMVGEKMIDLLIQATGLVQPRHYNKSKNRTVLCLEPTESARDLITTAVARGEAMASHYLPTVVPPKPWTTPFDGGYYFTPGLRLVKQQNQNFLEELHNRGDSMQEVYAAINDIQSTGYMVNGPVLDVARAVWERNLGLGKMPSTEAMDLPPKPHDIETNAEALTAWKREAVEVYSENAKAVSKRIQTARTIALASRLRVEDQFYYVNQMDFRGRIYPLTSYLNPQGHDLAKGLLTFSEGKPINDARALGWLMIHGANTYGADKCSMEERVQWVADREDDIMLVAADPLTNNWWSKASKPWMFLAFCFEYAMFQQIGFGYVSHLPIQLDGSCNGLQHFSAMLRDEVGGAAVNLIPGEAPEDIYQRVADAVTCKLKVLAANITETTGELSPDEILATQWLRYGISRSDCKRPVMVVPYSGTLFAVRAYVEEEIKKRIIEDNDIPAWGRKEHFAASRLLAGLTWDAINETVVAARQAMNWLQKVSKQVSTEGLPITWTTPDGFPVLQAYTELNRNRVTTMLGDSSIKITLASATKKIDKGRQASGISPNFVHSMDACALRGYVNIAKDNGVSSFCVVHDSFGTHAADTDISAACLRHAFVDMYLEHDVLEELRDSLAPIITEGEPPLPLTPPKGSLNLEAIREAEYFFA